MVRIDYIHFNYCRHCGYKEVPKNKLRCPRCNSLVSVHSKDRLCKENFYRKLAALTPEERAKILVISVPVAT